MPIPQFTSPDNEDAPILKNDAFFRAQFIRETKRFLNYVVTNGVEEGFVYYQLGDRMQAAWQEVAPSFDGLETDVQLIDSNTVTMHGLGGAQLRFKLANVAFWSQQVDQADRGRRNQAEQRWRNQAEQRQGLIAWFIKRLLKAINTLLKSILAALPGGTAVQEMKDAIEDALTDTIDELPGE